MRNTLTKDQLDILRTNIDQTASGRMWAMIFRHVDYLESIVDEDGIEKAANDRSMDIVEAALADRMEAIAALERVVEIAKKMRTVMLGQKIHNPVLDELAEIIE